jgi:hypothetical protein
LRTQRHLPAPKPQRNGDFNLKYAKKVAFLPFSTHFLPSTQVFFGVIAPVSVIVKKMLSIYHFSLFVFRFSLRPQGGHCFQIVSFIHFPPLFILSQDSTENLSSPIKSNHRFASLNNTSPVLLYTLRVFFSWRIKS